MNKAEKPKKRKEKFKPLPWLIALGVIALLCLGITLSYYIQNHRTVQKFTYDSSDGSYYDKKNDITYVAAPGCYTFFLKSVEEYATSDRLSFYYVGYKDGEEVHMSDPTAWLTTSFENGGMIYYNPKKVKPPETKNFMWHEIYLCNTGGVLFATQQLDAAVTDKLLDAYFDAPEEENLFDLIESGLIYDMGYEYLKEVRVTSYVYPSFYMVMRLYTDGKGGYYLASVYDRRMIKTDSTVFAPFFEDAE